MYKEHRGLLSIRYPMEHGIVRDWNDMERIWQYIFSKDQLQTFPEEVFLHVFSARQHADFAERAICYRPSVCPSLRLSHGWISRKGWS